MKCCTVAAALMIAGGLSTGCSSGRPGIGQPGSKTLSDQDAAAARDSGARAATAAVADGTLKLKEYPPLPAPAEHQEYITLLRERYGVQYEVLSLPPGVDEASFIQETRGWNEVMEAELERQHGADVFARLHEDARQRWQDKVEQRGTP